MRINFKGLTFINWLYLMVFSILILSVLWALQFLFLATFYQNMKLNELRNVGDSITAKYSGQDFQAAMNEYAFTHNLRIVLLNETGGITGRYDGFDSFRPNMRPDEVRGENGQTRLPPFLDMFPSGMMGVFPNMDFERLKSELAQSDDARVCYLSKSNYGDFSHAIYVSEVTDKADGKLYLYVSSPIPPIDSTISVLKTQFVIITVILFLLSVVAAQFISRRMSKPIIRLTQSAQRLAKGDLSVAFENGGFTEIHQLADTLNYATGELRGLENYRREFIANVSHDLKTPLTIIKFYGEMIKDVSGNNPPKRNEHCDTIIKEADWLADMVGEILELSKLESGNARFEKTEFDLSACLKDTLTSFGVIAKRDGYQFEVDIENGLRVAGSEQMLRRAFYNLISNAINYTGEDKRVIVSLKSEHGKIHFVVTDTGSGIPPDKIKAIWDRYYKLNEHHKRAVVGTGLGLSIVKHVLILHGAEYGVSSDVGKGSTFWFELEKASDFHI